MSTLCAAPSCSPHRVENSAGPSENRVLRWLDSRRTIHFIIAMSVMLRCAMLAILVHQPLVGDDTLYHDFALRLLQGKSFYPLIPPAVGFYLASVYRLLGVSPFIARASMLPVAIAFLYVLYAVAVRFAGRRGANLVALVFAILPLNLLCSVEPITETPASLLLLIVLFLVMSILAEARFRKFLLLGLVLAILILTRPSTLLLLFFLPLYLGMRSRKWLSSAMLLVIPALMVSAWISTVYRSTGHFVMINYSSSQNLFLGNDADTPLYRTWWFASHGNDQNLPASYQALNAKIAHQPWYVQNTEYRRLAIQAITSRPDLFAIRTLNRIRTYFAFDSYSGSLLLNRYHTSRKLAFAAMAIDGLLYILVALSAVCFLFIGAANRRRAMPTSMIIATIVIYAFPYFLSVSHPIYKYPVVPLMGILAAALWSGLS